VAIQTYKQPAVYIMASARNGTIYTGVTSNLVARDYQHKQGYGDGFSKKYGCTLQVWFEVHETMESAILREKQIKSWKRSRKQALIELHNLYWQDLSEALL
jgi:putative endonuclease